MISFSLITKDGQLPNPKEIKEIFKGVKHIHFHSINRYKVSFYISNSMGKNKTRETVTEVINTLTAAFLQQQYQDACQQCGATGKTAVYNMQGSEKMFCPSCFDEQSAKMEEAAHSKKQRKENIFTGIIGALLGSLIGAFSIVVLGQLGYVSFLSGLIMAVATLKGYELLGHKLSGKGIFISLVIMALMVYVGNRVDWAISIAQYLETDVFTAFKILPLLLEEGYLTGSEYYSSLALTGVFSMLGILPIVFGFLRGNKNEGSLYKISE